MTLDDLVKAYHAEYPTEQHACRAGIRAVVEALQEELLPLISTYSWDEIDAEKWFDEILASGEEKMAGGPTSNAGGPVEQQPQTYAATGFATPAADVVMTDARDVIVLQVLKNQGCGAGGQCDNGQVCICARDADAILSALNAAGLVVVPEDPTRKMLQAANQHMMDAEGTWRAMVEAYDGE